VYGIVNKGQTSVKSNMLVLADINDFKLKTVTLEEEKKAKPNCANFQINHMIIMRKKLMPLTLETTEEGITEVYGAIHHNSEVVDEEDTTTVEPTAAGVP
jgi:hypothetical protein